MNTGHIDAALAKIRTIFEAASDRIEALKPGEKITATGLAKDLAESYGMTGPQLYPTLCFLYKNYPGRTITRGAHGGICNPTVVTPVTPAVTSPDNTATDSVSDTSK